jgi:hypothetical protein
VTGGGGGVGGRKHPEQNKLLRAGLVQGGRRDNSVDMATGPRVRLLTHAFSYRVDSGVKAARLSNLTCRGIDEIKNGWSYTQLCQDILMAW